MAYKTRRPGSGRSLKPGPRPKSPGLALKAKPNGRIQTWAEPVRRYHAHVHGQTVVVRVFAPGCAQHPIKWHVRIPYMDGRRA